jgi:hypothetical protein
MTARHIRFDDEDCAARVQDGARLPAVGWSVVNRARAGAVLSDDQGRLWLAEIISGVSGAGGFERHWCPTFGPVARRYVQRVPVEIGVMRAIMGENEKAVLL